MPLPLCHRLVNACGKNASRLNLKSYEGLQGALEGHLELAARESELMLSRLDDPGQPESRYSMKDMMD